MRVRFLLVCEGSSDTSLVGHIERLLIACGASEADGSAFAHGSDVGNKIRLGLRYFGRADVLVVHRDANSAGPEARYEELSREVDRSGYEGTWVGLVPVRTMEAWLLADVAAIRSVAGRPAGQEPLADLPAPPQVEALSNPKGTLQQVLLQAGLPQGKRRRRKFGAAFSSQRRQLADALPIGGPLEDLDSWVRFRADLQSALTRLRGGGESRSGR